MSETSQRPRRGGGGGGGGQFNNRKRRFRDDDTFEDGRRFQRRRYEEPLSVQLARQIKTIAEAPHRRTDDDILHIAKTISENYFDTDLTNTFLDLAVGLSLEQPLKIPFVTAIVLHINTQKPEFTEEVLKKISETLQKSIDHGHWRDAKLLLRFLACLQGLFMGDGIFPFLEELFNRAAELQTQSSEDLLGLELVKIILYTIAYTMASSASDCESLAASLLDKTGVIASEDQDPELLKYLSLVDPFPSADSNVVSHESTLVLLQKHMQEESQRNWTLPAMPRPWQIPQSAETEDPLSTAQKHSFPTLQLPDSLQTGPTQIFPEIYLSVYADQDIDTVPPPSDPSAMLIRDAINDAINVAHYNRNHVAKVLIDIDCYFAPDTFVKRATAFDKLREVAGSKSTWKPEDIVVDAAFSQLLRLPAAEHKPVFYHSVLTESCKLAPAAVAPSLGRAIRYLYRNVGRMDLDIANRFLDWFAHHLSNFGFTWKWVEWVDDVELPDVHPKKAFILDTLDKEIRLSFAQRIKGVLPEQYKPLVAPEKEKDAPDFKYNDPSTPFSQDAIELMTKIRQKADDAEIAAILVKIEQDASDAGLADPKLASTDAYMTAICSIGSKTLSHTVALFERCRERILTIANQSPECRKQIISSVMEFWKYQTGTAIVIVDKLLNYRFVTPSTVIEWALVDNVNRGVTLTKTWCYELITKTLGKVTFRVRRVVAKIRDPQLSDTERATLQAALATEMASMKELFTAIEDAVISIASGSQDGMMESSDALRSEEEELLKSWGQKWLRVFRRRAATEESWVKEELAKPLPELPAEPVVDVQMQGTKPEDIEENSARNGNGTSDHMDGNDTANGIE